MLPLNMKRSVLILSLALFFFTNVTAQITCSQLGEKEASFTTLANKYFDISTPSARDIAEFEGNCTAYKSFFEQAIRENIYDLNMPRTLGLKVVMAHLQQLAALGKYQAVANEARYGYDYFFRFIDFSDNPEVRCSKGNSSMILTRDNFRNVATPFICEAVNASLEINNPALASFIFMGGTYKNALKRTGNLNETAGALMQYRLDHKLIDDTTFIVAYTYLNTLREHKSMMQLMKGFMKFPEEDALKVITDPIFIKHAPPLVKRGMYDYYPYAEYFEDLYAYLKDDSAYLPIQHGVLKMLFKVYNANDKVGIDVLHMSGYLRGSREGQAPGAKAMPTIQKIIDAGDKELMLLLADFIRDVYKKSDSFPSEDYGAYLLYHALGDERSANKMYSRIEKRVRDRYIKL